MKQNSTTELFGYSFNNIYHKKIKNENECQQICFVLVFSGFAIVDPFVYICGRRTRVFRSARRTCGARRPGHGPGLCRIPESAQDSDPQDLDPQHLFVTMLFGKSYEKSEETYWNNYGHFLSFMGEMCSNNRFKAS